MTRENQILGYLSDCRERFDRGETVRILCKAGERFMYCIRARRRGVAKGRIVGIDR